MLLNSQFLCLELEAQAQVVHRSQHQLRGPSHPWIYCHLCPLRTAALVYGVLAAGQTSLQNQAMSASRAQPVPH